jgi:hypothetical protein
VIIELPGGKIQSQVAILQSGSDSAEKVRFHQLAIPVNISTISDD